MTVLPSRLFAVSLAALAACAAPGGRPPGGAPPGGTPPAPSAPVLRETWALETPAPGFPLSIAVSGSGLHLYVAEKDAGLAVLALAAPDGPARRAAALGTDAFAGLDVMSVVRRGDRLYVALGDFFGNADVEAGLGIVDMSDPEAPEVLSVWTSEAPLGGAASVLVEGDFAYLGAMEHGVIVLDVSDEGAPRRIGGLLPDVDFPRPDPGATSHPNARGMALRGDLLYLAFDAGGLRVLDVSDPARPREVGRWINPGMGNKQQAYNEIALEWPYAYVALDYCGMEILDVADPAAIRQVGWWNPWGCERPTNLWFNSAGHTNHLSHDPARDVVFFSAGDSELLGVDVSDPAEPRRVAAYGAPKNGRAAWGMTRTGDRIHVAYIRSVVPYRGTWAGVRGLRLD